MKYAKHIDNTLKFTEGLTNFSGNSYLTNKKIKPNHKYYVYNKETENVVRKYNNSKMEVKEVLLKNNYNFTFYIDMNNRLSFIKTKNNQKHKIEKIIEKIELSPFFHSYIFRFFQAFIFFGIIRFRSYSFTDLELSIGYDKSINQKIKFLFPEKIRSKFAHKTNKLSLLIHICWCKIDFNKLLEQYHLTSDINNPIFIKVVNNDFNYYYNLKNKNKDKYNKLFYIYNSFSHRIKNTYNEVYFRKSITGQYVIVFTNRLKNTIKIKEFLAYMIINITRSNNIYNVYFEKFCEGASESAYELFKYAVKSDENAIYILDEMNNDYNEIKRKYPNNVYPKNSYMAFKKIFLANSFISSDLVTHIQRRLYDNDKLIKRKILETDKKIFLQHGVCLATNVFARGYYNTKVPISPNYIVVNSEYEKNMFLQNTGYKQNNLIKTGLPNLDLYYNSRKKYKNEITFFLTWRPWDLTSEIKEKSYLARYKQFLELIRNNKFYDDKNVNVILHPKSKTILKHQFPDFYNEYKNIFYSGDIKDALLKSKVLISDYSSLTFFGFAGGSNIIFYWEDKLRAEKEYGAPNILQKNNAFGDVVYEFSRLQKYIEKNFHQSQDMEYINKYRELVEYNTEEGNLKRNFEYIYNNII